MFLILSTTLFLAIPLIATIWRFRISLAKGQHCGSQDLLLGLLTLSLLGCSSLTPGSGHPESWIKLENQSTMKG